jgi:hypothetical protein
LAVRKWSVIKPNHPVVALVASPAFGGGEGILWFSIGEEDEEAFHVLWQW